MVVKTNRRNKSWIAPVSRAATNALIYTGKKAASYLVNKAYKKVTKPKNSMSYNKSANSSSTYKKAIKPQYKKKLGKTNFLKNGLQLNYENKGIVTDPECVYIGHGLPTLAVFRSLMRMIIKDLFEQSGVQILDFSYNVPRQGTQTYQIQIWYYPTVTATNLTQLGVISTDLINPTFEEIQIALTAQWDASFSVSENIPIIHKFTLIEGATALPNAPVSSLIYATDYFIELEYKSTLTLQNQTASGDGTELEDELVRNTNMNPLKGMRYSSFKWANYLLPKSRTEATLVSWTGFITSANTGTFTNTAANLGSGGLGSTTNLYKKPPNATHFQDVSAIKVSLNPGTIKDDNINFKCYMRFQQYIEKLHNVAIFTGNNPFCPIGRVQLFAFEHKLKSSAGEADASVAFENNYKIKMASSYKKPTTTVITIVN